MAMGRAGQAGMMNVKIREAIERVEELRDELVQLGKEQGYNTELHLAENIPMASTLHTYYEKDGDLVFRV